MFMYIKMLCTHDANVPCFFFVAASRSMPCATCMLIAILTHKGSEHYISSKNTNALLFTCVPVFFFVISFLDERPWE